MCIYTSLCLSLSLYIYIYIHVFIHIAYIGYLMTGSDTPATGSMISSSACRDHAVAVRCRL